MSSIERKKVVERNGVKNFFQPYVLFIFIFIFMCYVMLCRAVLRYLKLFFDILYTVLLVDTMHVSGWVDK